MKRQSLLKHIESGLAVLFSIEIIIYTMTGSHNAITTMAHFAILSIILGAEILMHVYNRLLSHKTDEKNESSNKMQLDKFSKLSIFVCFTVLHSLVSSGIVLMGLQFYGADMLDNSKIVLAITAGIQLIETIICIILIYRKSKQ